MGSPRKSLILKDRGGGGTPDDYLITANEKLAKARGPGPEN